MRSFASLRFVALVTLGLLIVTPSDSKAALPSEKAVTKLVSAAQGQVLGVLKQSLGAATTTFAQSLAALEAQLALGSDGPAAVEALFDGLVVLQTNVQASLVIAANARASAMKDILAGAGVTTEGIYPTACYPGQGTQAAKFDAAVAARLTKTYLKLRKRMAKTIKKIEAAGTHVNVRLDAPRLPPRIWRTDAIDFFIIRQSSIDVVVASSTAALNGDGTLRVAGEADSFAGLADDVTVSAVFDGVQVSTAETPVDGRYSADLATASLLEGVWLVATSQNSAIPIDATIGLR
jgi:hypothetical protein